MGRIVITKPPDFTMVELEPPPTLSGDQKALKANLDTIRKQATGKWYRIGRFEAKGAAGNRASAFRKKDEYKLYEFKGVPIDDGEDADGYHSELYCRWIGVPGQAGTPAREPLVALEGGAGEEDEDEEEGDGDADAAEPPRRRPPGRSPKDASRS